MAEPTVTTTTDPAQTEGVGRELARGLVGGEVIALSGELGAGKTTLVRGIAAALGIDPARVSSPTFVLLHEYEGGRLTLAHADAYRLASAGEFEALGLDDLLADGRVVLVVEWPERVIDALPTDRTIAVAIEPLPSAGDAAGAPARRITITPPPPAASRPWATCPTTGRAVPPDAPSWPFVDERARLADLYAWLAGDRSISRPVDADEAAGTDADPHNRDAGGAGP